MLNRIKAENVFATRIKTNILYETIEEPPLSDNTDEHLLKDELIQLTADRTKEIGISEHQLRFGI
jgi:hypothetical protein